MVINTAEPDITFLFHTFFSKSGAYSTHNATEPLSDPLGQFNRLHAASSWTT